MVYLQPTFFILVVSSGQHLPSLLTLGFTHLPTQSSGPFCKGATSHITLNSHLHEGDAAGFGEWGGWGRRHIPLVIACKRVVVARLGCDGTLSHANTSGGRGSW